MGSYTHRIKLKDRREAAAGTLALRFEKPDGFAFRPGQAVDISIPTAGADGAIGLHSFSLASAPHERDLLVATRVRESAYKRALAELATGTPVTMDGPFGMLALPEPATRPAVLIAGGIGVTPFLSILQDAARSRSSRRWTLLYSNRRPEEAVFLGELRRLERDLASFRLVATMTRTDGSGRTWQGPVGRIDEARLRHVASDLADPMFLVAGAPTMVQSMYELLTRIGVPDKDIQAEDFAGY